MTDSRLESIPHLSVRRLSHQVLARRDGRLIRINPRDAAVPSRDQVSLRALQAIGDDLACDNGCQ